MKCKYCDTEHPEEQIANPHYCIAMLEEAIEARDKQIAALERTATDQTECLLHFQARVAKLTAEVEEALRLKRWAYLDIKEVGRLLDLMGAPGVQDSGFPYSIIGRLSALTGKIIGESWRAKINTLTAEVARWNPCGHTGFESISCEICGYPDSRKLIKHLRDENERLKILCTELIGPDVKKEIE